MKETENEVLMLDDVGYIEPVVYDEAIESDADETYQDYGGES